MADYTVRLIPTKNGGWNWLAEDADEVLRLGYGFTLWDAVNDAYRAVKDELNKDGGTQW